jgi:hypothetical protein
LLRFALDKFGRGHAFLDLDALILPAGFVVSDQWLGPLSFKKRVRQLEQGEVGIALAQLSHAFDRSSPGAVLAVGIDTQNPSRHWRGDQVVVGYRSGELVGLARKIYPVAADTDGGDEAPLLLFKRDFDDDHRFVELPSGGKAVLSVCYDAFVYREMLRGPTPKLKAMRYIGNRDGGWGELARHRAETLIQRFRASVELHRPIANLIAIHAFSRPGTDMRWQMHGIATASAALEGALTVGAAHFYRKQPSGDQSPLAAFNVPEAQLGPGPQRHLYRHPPSYSQVIRSPTDDQPLAIARLFEDR